MFKRLTLSLMVFLLLLPSIASILGVGNFYPINENRYKLSLSWDNFEAYFNDNFGFRDLFIRFKNQLLFTVFHYSSELYFGDNDYMSYYNDTAVEQINNEMITEERFKEITDAFKRVKTYCDEQGFTVCFIIAPQKNTVFPETSDNFPVKRPSPNMYERFAKFFEEEMSDVSVNTMKILREAEKKAPTFYYQDFHWNDWGAAATFEKAITLTGRKVGIEKPYDMSKLQILDFSLPRFSGAQIDSLSVILPPKFAPSVTVSAPTMSYNVYEEESYPYLEHFKNPNEAVMPHTALFIGDSYTTPAVATINDTNPGFVDCFSETYSIHYNNSKGLLLNPPEGTKYVFIEFIESVLSYCDMYLNNLLEVRD